MVKSGGKKAAFKPNLEIYYFSLYYSYFGVQETCHRTFAEYVYLTSISPFSLLHRHNVNTSAIVNSHSPQYFPGCLNSKLISCSPDFIMIFFYSASVACLKDMVSPGNCCFWVHNYRRNKTDDLWAHMEICPWF